MPFKILDLEYPQPKIMKSSIFLTDFNTINFQRVFEWHYRNLNFHLSFSLKWVRAYTPYIARTAAKKCGVTERLVVLLYLKNGKRYQNVNSVHMRSLTIPF